mmetsp:Transcript_10938/g.12499  ORF Transcript_10938/g.12499 Transcript_10938/m.12499 type:complete len:407 (-) Transcript_10938:357-1577(-)
MSEPVHVRSKMSTLLYISAFYIALSLACFWLTMQKWAIRDLTTPCQEQRPEFGGVKLNLRREIQYGFKEDLQDDLESSPFAEEPILIWDEDPFVPKKEFLLFAAIGNRSSRAVSGWTQDLQRRNFDIVLYYYDSAFQAPKKCPVDLCVNMKGYKWPLLYHFLSSNRLTADSYQSVFAVDDDIIIDTLSINLMFHVFKTHGLVFAQPGLKKGGDLHFRHSQEWRANTEVRYMNFVENQAMVVHFPTALKLQMIMRHGFTGWGVDYCFFSIIDTNVTQIGTIMAVMAEHPISTDVTSASHAFKEGQKPALLSRGNLEEPEESLNREVGEQLIRDCGGTIFRPRVYFKIRPGENRLERIKIEMEKMRIEQLEAKAKAAKKKKEKLAAAAMELSRQTSNDNTAWQWSGQS